MEDLLQNSILKFTGAVLLSKAETIQSLWSGYGEISRYQLQGGIAKSVVVKHVQLPDQSAGGSTNHPRGWNTSLSHQRKITSYEVETAWYRRYSQQCHTECRVPQCYGVTEQDGTFLIVLEDLDANGFPVRKTDVNVNEMQACLRWLASFHAQFLFDRLEHASTDKFGELWEVGCYWHLDTRPDELAVLKDASLKNAASKIDEMLKQCRYQTLVHGDAKLANFCFSESDSSLGSQVAAVDFQYVGKGCGMKDVAYFIGSCLDADGCEQYAEVLLNDYFKYLTEAMTRGGSDILPEDVISQWRPLFAVAWADFHRFMKGWSPDHWKINPFSERITQQVLDALSIER